MNALDPGYTIEVDKVDKETWHRLLPEFDDSCFYQTWSYGAVQWGEGQLSHLILKHTDRVVSMAQLRVIGIPALRIGTAYLNWGPIWRRKGESPSLQHLRNMARALRVEYAVRRGYLLRMLPRIAEGSGSSEVRATIEQERFAWHADPIETVILDLSRPIADLRRSLGKSWSRSLSFAEKQGLQVTEDCSERSCEIALGIAEKMIARKQVHGSAQATAAKTHRDLPPHLKLHIGVCWDNGTPVASLGWTTFGTVGILLLAATGQEALKSKASFLLWWKMVEFYSRNRFQAVDLGGVSESRNPGGYFFKTGLSGQNFRKPDSFIGQFDAWTNPVSALAARAGYAFIAWRNVFMFGLRQRLREGRRAAKQEPPPSRTVPAGENSKVESR